MNIWRVAAEQRTIEGHGQFGLGVLITNTDTPIRVVVALPMASDDAVRLAANYIVDTLNLGEVL